MGILGTASDVVGGAVGLAWDATKLTARVGWEAAKWFPPTATPVFATEAVVDLLSGDFVEAGINAFCAVPGVGTTAKVAGATAKTWGVIASHVTNF